MRFSLIRKNKGFQKNYMKVGGQEVVTSGYGASQDVGSSRSGMGPTERLKLRRQMAAAAGKKSAPSLSLFMEAFGLEVEEDLSTLATQ